MKTSHSSIGSLCLAMLLLMIDTFTNPVMLFFLCLSWPSSKFFTRLITERVYWNDALGVIYFVDCCALTALISNCSLTPNVLTSMGNPWAPFISAESTTKSSTVETFLEVSGAVVEIWDWQVDVGIVLAALGCWVLAAFGGGELLAIYIPTLRPLIFLLSLYCPCLCNDDIKSEHAHNRHTRWGWRDTI